jgi:hypothetical protein
VRRNKGSKHRNERAGRTAVRNARGGFWQVQMLNVSSAIMQIDLADGVLAALMLHCAARFVRALAQQPWQHPVAWPDVGGIREK